jgi:hypothetical protein
MEIMKPLSISTFKDLSNDILGVQFESSITYTFVPNI